LAQTPLSSTITLDDTPESHDPLEDDPQSVTGLSDEDLETPTTINLGDSAPPVREFGGDYRNIRYDFGDLTLFDSARLYVDRRLQNPELFRWRIFITDDPDGRLWVELGADQAAASYGEWGSVLQGWEITFSEDVPGRFLKLVDVKLGNTGPDLFVTELVVFVRESTDAEERREDSQDHSLDATLAYAVAPTMRVGYDGHVRRRVFGREDRDVDEANHGVHAGWAPGSYSLTGRADLHTVSSERTQNTDARSYQLALARRWSTIQSTMGWNRTDDRSGDRDRTTDSYTLSSNWQAAPGLRLTQQISHGYRRDRELDTRSKSISLSHRVHSVPFATLRVELQRADRWVDNESGSGFQGYHDSEFYLSWFPVPLISISSRLRYEERADTEEWTARQFLTWSPLREGRIEPTFSANSYYDSRADAWQYGGQLSVLWQVRPGLRAEGDAQLQKLEIAGRESTPLGTNIQLTWST
jgi:hypothetical protein